MNNKKGINFIVVILVCIAFLNFFSSAFGQDIFKGNTNGNISNLGYISSDEEWIYYSNIEHGSKLYKSKMDNKEEKSISEDIPNYINVVGDWIYYSNVKDGFKIYKIKKDGTERTKLNNDYSHWVKVVGEWIYYAKKEGKGQTIYKVKVGGGEKTKISDDKIFGFIIKDSWIYYSNESDNNRIYKVKLDGSEKLKLNDEQSILIDIVDNNIYYQNHSDKDKTYKMNLDGKNNIKISDDSAVFQNIVGDEMFFSNVGDSNKIYKMNLDGKNKLKLSDDSAGEINIVGNHIYYWKASFDESKKMNFDSTKLYRVKKDGTSKEIFKVGKEEETKDKEMSWSSILIVFLILGLATFMEIWKLVSTRKITKFVNNLKGEITNEEAKNYITLIKRSRIVKRSDIYILLRTGVNAVNSSYKVDYEIKQELNNILLKRGINLNNNTSNNQKNLSDL